MTAKKHANRRGKLADVVIDFYPDHFLGEFIEDAAAKAVGKSSRRKHSPRRSVRKKVATRAR